MAEACPRALPRTAIDGAILWHVRLASSPSSRSQEDAFAHWYGADPNHAEAWKRIEALCENVTETLTPIPAAVSRDVLSTARPAQRRRALKLLVLGGAGLAGGYFLREPLGLSRQWHLATADLRTAVGEQKRLTLADGSVLRLNTASAVDVRFDQHLRRIVLREGELHIATAPDALGRRLVVDVPSARLAPVGTRFGARIGDAGTLVTVQEGAVDLMRTAASPVRIVAGQQLRFDRLRPGRPMPLDDSAVAWTEGMIRADRMPLGDFLAELSRYRRGWIRCEASVAQLRLTALHPLTGPDPVQAILETLPQTLPVSIRRLSPWLTLVGPAQA